MVKIGQFVCPVFTLILEFKYLIGRLHSSVSLTDFFLGEQSLNAFTDHKTVWHPDPINMIFMDEDLVPRFRAPKHPTCVDILNPPRPVQNGGPFHSGIKNNKGL